MTTDKSEADRAIRDRAARHYFRPKGITGTVSDWIESGEDPQNEVDEDVKDMAALLADVRRETIEACAVWLEQEEDLLVTARAMRSALTLNKPAPPTSTKP